MKTYQNHKEVSVMVAPSGWDLRKNKKAKTHECCFYVKHLRVFDLGTKVLSQKDESGREYIVQKVTERRPAKLTGYDFVRAMCSINRL